VQEVLGQETLKHFLNLLKESKQKEERYNIDTPSRLQKP
jgi:hypothetical protein